MRYFNDVQMYTYFLYVNKNEKKIFDFRGIKRHYSHGFHGLKLFQVVFKMKFESMQYNLVCEI